MTEKVWVRKSLRELSISLFRQGIKASKNLVRRLLKDMKYSLRVNCRSLSAQQHPERDKQMRYIKCIRKRFIKQGYPVISIDAKKTELIGNFANKGESWCEDSTQVNIYDVPQIAEEKVIPYGIYDLAHNKGYVYLGTSGNTPEFAATVVATWWQNPQRERFKKENRLYIFCDAGGANGHRFWAWKYHLQKQLADAFGITVIVSHYPTGASKFNPIEHRLFSQISRNWAAQPLVSMNFMLRAIRGTSTQLGLQVFAYSIKQTFETGSTLSKEQKESIKLKRRTTCPDWNYQILPTLSKT